MLDDVVGSLPILRCISARPFYDCSVRGIDPPESEYYAVRLDTLFVVEGYFDLAQLPQKQEECVLQLKKLIIDDPTISFALNRVVLIMQVQGDSRQIKRKRGISFFLPSRCDHAHSRIAFSVDKIEREVPGLDVYPPGYHKD